MRIFTDFDGVPPGERWLSFSSERFVGEPTSVGWCAVDGTSDGKLADEGGGGVTVVAVPLVNGGSPEEAAAAVEAAADCG